MKKFLNNNKGITLVFLMAYIILALVVVGVLATLSTNFRQNLNELDMATVQEMEFDKLNLQLLTETKNKGNNINEAQSTKTKLVFLNGNTYTYSAQDQSIYLNDSIKIADNIENCSFSVGDVDSKKKITVTASINGTRRVTEYIISPEIIEDVLVNFAYTGEYQTFTAPYTGIYKVELWGAQGGSYSSTYYGGLGGYTRGLIKLNANETLLVYVGSAGVNQTEGYNGGGKGIDGTYGNGGGGATDIRTDTSILSRIMVAGGGGGATDRGQNYGSGSGGAGGGLIGISGVSTAHTQNYGYGIGKGGEQSSGGLMYWTDLGASGTTTGNYSSWSSFSNVAGTFAQGGTLAAGGGGGYYGGAASAHGGAGGGSSFISGHNGCNAIAESSTTSNITHTGQSVHYSGYKFTDTVMIDGDGYKWTTSKGSYTGMPTHDGTGIMAGNTGNGYARISLQKN